MQIPFRLQQPSIWLRLRYALNPDRADPRAFAPQRGIVALSQIAAHAFEIKVGQIGLAHRGSPYTIQVQSVHPGTRIPVADVRWSALLHVDDATVPAARVIPREGGFVDLVFQIPSAPHDDSDSDDRASEVKVEVTGQLGDFVRTEIDEIHLPDRSTGRLQTDKPIYQPGQTIHLRALIFDSEGHAAEGAKVTLRIDDPGNDRVHTAQLVSSHFGVVQDDWTLPESSGLGNYNIAVTREDDEYYRIAQHVIRVSRYELPTFSVTVKPDRPAYLIGQPLGQTPGQPASVEIRGAYLFGKPVPKGKVRIVRIGEPIWNSQKRKNDTEDEEVAKGEADQDGVFLAHVDLSGPGGDLRDQERDRFKDLHYAAYYTDPGSGRTEQRKFDLRITREPIHVYVVRANASGPLPAPVYVSTYYADGRPAETTVELKLEGQTATARTNRYGAGKAYLVFDHERGQDVQVRAVDGSGAAGTWTEHLWSSGHQELRLETDRTIYRTGDAVSVRITAPDASGQPADRFLMLNAVQEESGSFASRVVHLVNGKGEAIFPYQAEFHRTVSFIAWNGLSAEGRYDYSILGLKSVIFPDKSDLELTASAEKRSYRPGEKASLQLTLHSAGGQPVEGALGVAIVDQAVFERARTDSEFGQRPWFACAFCFDSHDAAIGGVSLNDLFHLPAAKPIPEGLDLVAEALVAQAVPVLMVNPGQNLLSYQHQEFKPFLDKQLQGLTAALDAQYVNTLQYPRSEAALAATLGNRWYDLHDPWGRQYTAKFRVQGSADLLEIVSSGPDKSPGTADDFSIGIIRRSYFLPLQRLMERILADQQDYPPTEKAFQELVADNGLRLDTLRDPWGTPYRAQVTTRGASRTIAIRSAGPDKGFDTEDDVFEASFSGRYFQRETAAIANALRDAPQPPQTLEQFQNALKNAGIDIGAYRDAWGRPYRLVDAISSRYNDRTSLSTVRVYGGPTTARREVTPVTQAILTFALRSAGADGLEDTYDDFAVATFPVLLREESAGPSEQRQSQPATLLRGTGIITGTVADPTGAVVPNAQVQLFDSAVGGIPFETTAGQDGVYRFASVPVGIYTLRVDVPGFKRSEIQRVPVTDGRVTDADITLDVGSTTESVTVSDVAQVLNTESSAVLSAAVATGTPRVREYFPETLLWAPELLTDAQGHAKLPFALADTVTTWKIAVIASTLLRAFQPFFLDFNPPPVLTSGDQIELPATVRNYVDHQQKVAVELQPNDWSSAQGLVTRRLTVAPNSSANVGYSIRALTTSGQVRQRITAIAGRNRDAIEKPIRIHPDGQEVKQSFGDLVSGRVGINVNIPPAAIQGATTGEIRVYPNVLAMLLESAGAILITPHGCAEQTISAGYANLTVLRYARALGVRDTRVEKTALGNIAQARDALAGFREPNGGIRYWGTGEPDIAVTAYALSFLVDASTVVEVDHDDIEQPVSWLAQKQGRDGLWTPAGRDRATIDQRAILLTGSVARSLAAAQKAGVKVPPRTLIDAYHHLGQFTDATAEPYMLATFTLAALDSGDAPLVSDTAMRLAGLAREERGGAYWDLRANTPFYGWGTAGRLETSALAVSALAAWRTQHAEATQLDPIIRRGLVFLLRGRDSFGSWYSTQATLRVMRAFADSAAALGNFGGKGGSVDVRVNGRSVKTIPFPDDPRSLDPILLDASAYLSAGVDNRVEFVPSGGAQAALVRITATHWLPWAKTQPLASPELRLSVKFDRQDGGAGEQIRCSVEAERVGFRGYGMMLAEIGLPPGAEVDRASLETILDDSSLGVSRYDVLPDRVVLYLWPEAGGVSFDFYLRARIRMQAKSAASLLYDYYNPEAAAEVAPAQFTVR